MITNYGRLSVIMAYSNYRRGVILSKNM